MYTDDPTSTTVRVGELDVAYSAAGAGSPVVFIHGLAENHRTWWVQQRDCPDLRTYAYDLRGHGGTSLGEAEGTLEQLGGDLVRFLETVTGPATVVGFSLGGTVALWAAAHRDDLVTRVVALGTSSVVGRAAADFYATRIGQATDVSSPEFREALHADTAVALAVEHEEIADIVSDRLAAVGTGAGYANAATAMASLNQTPLTPLLPNVQAPVDVVTATEDTLCPPKAAKIICDALPTATYHEIEGAGHLMNIDNPNAVTAIVRAAVLERN